MPSLTLSQDFSSSDEQVIKAYLAYYGRAPDAEGFTFWSNAIVSQGGLSLILDDFGNSDEFTERFGAFSNEELIINLYQQILGRTPDPEGLLFFTSALNNQTQTLQNIALDIINGAKNDDLVRVDLLVAEAKQSLTPNGDENAAARFLAQSTFGPTTSSINHLLNVGTEQWITDQFNVNPSLHAPSVLEVIGPYEGEEGELAFNRRMETWWTVSVLAEDQLRQRMAFALSQFFVVSEVNDEIGFFPQAAATYYDILVNGSFGNFRDLLEKITLSPVMGVYLSTLGNQKPEPEEGIRADENFAREIMQLFTIGLNELNQDGSVKTDGQGQPIATYNLEDIKNLARVFTGWTNENDSLKDDEFDFISQMKPIENRHDTDQKILFNGTVVIPAGGSARADLKIALDTLFNHPNVGPFFGKQLIQRLVTSNPSPEYVARVAAKFANNGSGIRGDLSEVIRAVLLDQEASTGHITNPNVFGKLREPVLRMTHLWRAFNGRAVDGRIPFTYPKEVLSQAPLRAASVFNFYRPDHIPSGELRNLGVNAPEFQITNESSVVRLSNFLADSIHYRYNGVDGAGHDDVLLDLSNELALADTPEALLEHLDLLLMSGQMPAEMKQIIISHITDVPYLFDDVPPGILRVLDALFLVTVSPEYAVQR